MNILAEMALDAFDQLEKDGKIYPAFTPAVAADAKEQTLRTAVDLARLLADRGQRKGARSLLQPVIEQFVEGSDTADLKAAERLLATLG